MNLQGTTDEAVLEAISTIVGLGADLANQIDKAITLISDYGDIDGAHHKQWVIDQVLRVLLADSVQDDGEDYSYQAWINAYEDEVGREWDQGIAP